MYKLVIVLILLLSAIFYLKWEYICTRLVIPDIVEWRKPSQKTPPLYGDKVVRQYFAPNFNGFFRVGFSLEYGESSAAKIEVTLREKVRDRELFNEVIPLSEFSKNKRYRFSFAPQWDSARRSYYLTVSAPQVKPETGLRLLFDQGPFFHINTKGKLYFGNEELPGELSMVTECRVEVKKNEFLSFWHNLLADRGFAIFYISLIIGLVITFPLLV